MKKARPTALPAPAILLAFLILLSHQASGKIIYVGPGETYQNIMYGLAQAKDGDTVMVRDGVYVQEIKVRAGVVLMAEHRYQAVIGDGSDIRSFIAIRQEPVDGAVIEGFKFVPGAYPGIRVGDMSLEDAPRNCIIKNNYIEGRKIGIDISPNSSHTTITGNTITGNRGPGIACGGAGDHTITNNFVEDCEGPGIILGDRDDIDVVGNTLVRGNTTRNNQGAGIVIERPRVRIERNLVEANWLGINTNSGKTDIVIADSNLVIYNNEVGINIENGCELTIDGNVISFNGREGIQNRGSTRIIHNYIENNEFGILNNNGSVHIEDNDIMYSGIHGVEIFPISQGAIIHNNRIRENAQCGIYTQQEAVLTGNTIEDNSAEGIFVTGQARGVEIRGGNTIARNLGWEIGLDEGTSALIYHNTIEDDTTRMEEQVRHSGIYILGSATLTGNLVRKMNGAGIYVDRGAGEVLIKGDNTITQNKYGIIVKSGTGITHNSISDNEEFGIWIYQPSGETEVSWNTVEGSHTGIFCDSAQNGIKVTWNSIRGNTIGMNARGEIRFRRNTVQGNQQMGLWIEGGGIDLGSTGAADGGPSPDSGLNAFLENGEWNIRNDAEDSIHAAYNYWGMFSADSIDASIMDDDEESLSGPVLFEPFLGDLNVGERETPGNNEPGNPVLSVYPNPTRGAMQIRFTLSAPGPVSLSVYDLSGRHVRDLLQGAHYPAGTHRIRWKAEPGTRSADAGGIFLIILRSEGKESVRKVNVVRQ